MMFFIDLQLFERKMMCRAPTYDLFDNVSTNEFKKKEEEIESLKMLHLVNLKLN